MIIQTDINYKNYQAKILDISSGYRGGEIHRGMFRCPNNKCLCDRFYRHGIYVRYFFIVDETEAFPDPSSENALENWISTQQYRRVEILRVKCCGCGMTHAILPADMIPFRQISVIVFLFLCLAIFLSSIQQDATDSADSSVPEVSVETPVLHESKTLSWHFLRCLLIGYALYKERMISILRYYELHRAAAAPADTEILSAYIHNRASPNILFLRHFQTPLFVTRRNTVSYPLRYIIA